MTEPRRPRRASGSVMVALGIAASRLAGLGRETVASRLLGNTAAGDAFAVAMRIPNMLQNLLGEGVLSASFVPVYSRLLDEGARDEDGPTDPGQVAGAVAAALMAVVGLSVALIVTLARPITFVLAPGLTGDRLDLAVSLVRITALGTGFAVLSAWCLGVLNSHRRFFVSYAAPVLWNAVQVGALVVAWILAFDLDGVARALAWGVAGGGLAQLLVQLPLTVRLARGLRLRWIRGHPGLREIRRRFGPAVLGRGVVQVSAYVDLMLASLLATGAMAALYRAQILYMLPVSLFAMSVAAAELPEMSRQADDPVALATRSRSAMRKVAFWMLLAAAVYIAAGDLVVGLLFQGGVFSEADTVLVWFVVGAYALGLPATGLSRVLQNVCYARGDTAGPAGIAAVRVAVAAAVGLVVMFPLDRVVVSGDRLLSAAEGIGLAWALPEAERALGDVVRLGAVGLALGSAVAAWTEIVLLARRLRTEEAVRSALGAPTTAAAVAFAATAALKLLIDGWPLLLSAPIAAAFAMGVYTVVAYRRGVAEAHMLLQPVRRALWPSRD
ncbi:MAG: murein biosynthesis integral membrane protein MurJ [Acidimicrobiaceae bacterium]|nr:murein biosynthesis integral membrane protein MurJ [Acidimicrobiaceae bacterium]MYI52558.1 murein biosynthesis integral membrane protein MurJ [Acidimicrobiaceae bacterium]MYJ42885.1 murein biosynthesis integral membrane protein MurJ [Acidimicrobiaceae bacterium]